MRLDYDVRVKKAANRKTQENSSATVNLAQLKYITGMEDLRRASDSTIRKKIRDALRDGIDLNPEYPLEPTEYVIVLPNPRVGKKKRQFAPAIYKDDMDIPERVVNTHRETRRKRGYQ